MLYHEIKERLDNIAQLDKTIADLYRFISRVDAKSTEIVLSVKEGKFNDTEVRLDRSNPTYVDLNLEILDVVKNAAKILERQKSKYITELEGKTSKG